MNSDWAITYNNNATGKRSYGQESLMSLGNGYIGWRGAPIWSSYSENHYPGLYIAGVFNQTKTEISGRDVINEDLVNLPNPQLMKIYINNILVDFDKNTTKRESTIDFKNGVQIDNYSVQVDEGELTLKTTKYVDPIEFHKLGIKGTIISNFDAKIRIESLIDGEILNQNVERYRDFNSKEFDIVIINGDIMTVKTLTTNIDISIGSRTWVDKHILQTVKDDNSNKIVQKYDDTLYSGKEINFEKIIVLYTSNENSDPFNSVSKDMVSLSLENIISNNEIYWSSVWRDWDVKIDSDSKDLQVLTRMNIFHIRQAAQHNANRNLDVSVGSRALTGEGYRGHIFWDELLVLPYYAANDPKTAKDLLKYRIKRLSAAKKNALIDGEEGAMYPWQSGLYGDEQSQLVHLNTVNNKWESDNSRRQRHVSLAVVYNIWIYIQYTGDETILDEGGLELLLETTKFWINKAEKGKDGRYHIEGVMGPDEYHEAYPGKEGGIKDNAYTNIMLVWQINWLLSLENHLMKRFSIDDSFFVKAKEISKKIHLNVNSESVIEQYDSFFDLKNVNFSYYKEKYGDIHRIDRLLKSENLSPNDYKVIKQADTLMALYNLGSSKVKTIVEQLGYNLSENWVRANRDYYLEFTVHGSTISRPVFSGISIDLGELEDAFDTLLISIASDYRDIQGGTTAEGIHLGVMGETLKVIQNEFCGVDMRDGQFCISPKLPISWRNVKLTQLFRGTKIKIEIDSNHVLLTPNEPISVIVYEHAHNLKANKVYQFDRQ
ncbi:MULTISPECIES: glycosyl hydrolase family 65 protein [unclassified Lactococcus]|uniref:glycosyl hydrolase family 65 protein n=1 Tax=unclassified Lactococcus TaxID=2643510 RepID=UPI0011C85173|nr:MULTISPECIES: glycosyl hydrolase family 65 protein [unclassified Lactococcus]MQW24068.1 glycoside hydrolase family 65 protein [Lactococcus sp. dk101]TXK36472.1 glycoside hydrolase family 65 protein [Lactococcus sp. dk310]TXK47176.1 glycoside hydrolase family 65 protein [Lactococcus sp. dk322]